MELFQKFSAEEAKPRTKAETIAYLTSQGEAFASFLEDLSDEFLAEPVAMPPGAEPATKTRFEMLLSPKEHEMHHRGQLMLLQRMIGLVPHLTRQMQERMPPGAEPATKTRFEMLLSPKEHEMHHRGQLMLLQRMIGLVPHLTRQMAGAARASSEDYVVDR